MTVSQLEPAEARVRFRGGLVTPTAGLCGGYMLVTDARDVDYLVAT